MDKDKALRDHLLNLLKGRGAHVDFDQAVKNFPEELRGKRPANAPYSAWELLEHLRRAQNDILEFSRDPNYVSPPWPEGYWPKSQTPPDSSAWDKSVKAFQKDLKDMQDMVADSKNDLYEKIPHGEGQTILREALLVADHNAYHIGEMVVIRKLLGAWPA
ncbi:MAG: DinB family protein [Calditrichia bacterium]